MSKLDFLNLYDRNNMMKNLVIAAIVVVVGLAIARAEARKPKFHLSKMPLTAEQMAVYKAFLTSERPFEDEHGAVSLANSTFPLDISDELAKNDGCLKGIDFRKSCRCRKDCSFIGS